MGTSITHLLLPEERRQSDPTANRPCALIPRALPETLHAAAGTLTASIWQCNIGKVTQVANGDGENGASARSTTDNWIADWIEEQREKLRSANAGASASQQPGTQSEEHAAADSIRGIWQTVERMFAQGPFDVPPPLGWAREHEQAYRDLAIAHAQYMKLEAELRSKLAAVQSDALSLLERRARERPIENVRQLYDLWIECGEEVFGQLARQESYCKLQADFANAAVQFRACQREILERMLKQFDLPTRAELNSVHRQLRELRERLARYESTGAKRTASSPARSRVRKVAKKRAKTRSVR